MPEIEENDWLAKSVVYQIYPRSFLDTTGNGIGDLQGIIEKLDYLKDLGVDVIWLSPIYPSPMVDYGYDITDFKNIDPIFGSLEIFDQLVNGVHDRGMKLLMDFVPNHTSSLHPWFVESRSSKDNPKRKWYTWQDPDESGKVPNNWLSVFGGPAWTLDDTTGQYYLHSFFRDQPDLNWRNLEVRQEMMSTMRWWLERGVDGFRVDAIPHLFEDKDFRDNPKSDMPENTEEDPYEILEHRYTNNLTETLAMVREMSELVREYEGALVFELHFDTKSDDLLQYYRSCANGAICQAFNFRLINMPWQADKYRTAVAKAEEALGSLYTPNWVLGNHDRNRLATRVGREKARLLSVMQMTLRGTPFIYYGEELGMVDGHLPDKKNDPRGKLTPSRDPVRTPMQWSSSKHAGFSQNQPWLPVCEDFNTYNVETETEESNSMLDLYKRLIGLRKASLALQHGDYKNVEINVNEVYAYTRAWLGEEWLVLLNFSDQEQHLSLPEMAGSAAQIYCATHDCQKQEPVDLKNFTLPATEGWLVKAR